MRRLTALFLPGVFWLSSRLLFAPRMRPSRAPKSAFSRDWIQAFDRMPADSEAAAKQYLATRAAERAAEAPQDPSGIRDRMMRIWLETPPPPGWLFTVVGPIRKEAERQQAVLTAPRTKPAVLEAASPPVVTSRRVEMTNFVPVVKNLRDVPIEAIGLELLHDSGRPRSGISTDYRGTDVSASFRVAIAFPEVPRGSFVSASTCAMPHDCQSHECHS